ncbi:Hsp20/alpha crystallin family protein [Fusibacter bizertensis]|uniref:Hsp20/alpha crystallin family protein n=1 Tax=Fusibacter bizertensis TaxID=1488331 RepID=A0ABT6NE02_9FIRM|nr:Hsp20/alpha crystallin family protein [Fusibacter bizertensis]MDH8678664.1 Hsp20/alpha crystallin family protein [Fusibacter bizertensis]
MLSITPFVKNSMQRRNGDGFEDFYNMLDDFFNNSWINDRSQTRNVFKMDIKDEENAFIVEAEMPGIKKEEIKINYIDNQLVISVESQQEQNNDQDNYIHRERRYSSQKRSVQLRDVDSSQIDAKLDEGILKIVLPKLEHKVSKTQIEIK